MYSRSGELPLPGVSRAETLDAEHQITSRGQQSDLLFQQKKAIAMRNQPKIRQASMIVFAIAVILILPNLTHFVR